MSAYKIFSLGDQAVTISLGNNIDASVHAKITGMAQWLKAHAFPGLTDVVIAYSSLTIVYDAYIAREHTRASAVSAFVYDFLKRAFDESNASDTSLAPVIRIPVCYEEPFAKDIEFISQRNKISHDELIMLHTSRTYDVYLVGFLPGFPYMAAVDEKIAAPRKQMPRQLVEAGSVGIAGIQTGIYPTDSPGGWQIIGRTPVKMFNADKNPPVKLVPGNKVQFYNISYDEFNQFNE